MLTNDGKFINKRVRHFNIKHVPKTCREEKLLGCHNKDIYLDTFAK